MSEPARERAAATALSTRAAAAERPDGIALVVEGEELTWVELARRVAAAGQELLALGALDSAPPVSGWPAEVPRVAVLGERRLDVAVAVLALIELGAPFALLHPRWVATERRRIVDALLPAVVLDESWRAPESSERASARFEAAAARRDLSDDERPLAVPFT
ncbi:MAG TPA: AMP-binding protein, partial [Thermoanaerobaculia bacterium]|nr:AMP-binding protein [Thermoanaerobaculia bacterium]